MALWCNWLTRRPLKAESPGSSPGNATKFLNHRFYDSFRPNSLLTGNYHPRIREQHLPDTDLPPWYVVYYQMQRWLRAGCFATMVEDLRSLLREFAGRKAQPTSMIPDSRRLSGGSSCD